MLSIAISYSQYSYPPQDGLGRLVDVFARALAERGHDVHIVARSATEEQTSLLGYAKLHRITYDLSRYASYASLPKTYHVLNYSHAVYHKLRQLVAAEGVQLLLSPVWLVEGLVSAASKLLPVVAVAETTQGKINQIHGERSLDDQTLAGMERLLLLRSKGVICISRAAEAMLRETYDLNLNTYLVYLASDASEDDLTDEEKDRLTSSTSTVLFVGRLEKRKGIQALFEAIPIVVKRVPSVQFIIAGKDNSENDGFLREKGMTYPEFFKRNFPQLCDRVCFTGYVNEEDLRSLYKKCDVFVAPSLFESFGFVFLEAMRFAKPVVSCRAGGIPEVVQDGETGILVEPGNSMELAAAIVDLLLDSSKRRAMGQRGRRRLLTEFSISRLGEKLEESILQILERSKEV